MTNIRLAVRDLARRPMFAATIILTLTIGIGTTIAAFAFIDAVFLTQLPVRDQDRVVILGADNPASGYMVNVHGQWAVPWDARTQLVQQQRAFADVAAFISWGSYPFAARDGDHVVHLMRTSVSGNFFDVLGAKPEIGRLLRPEDDVVGAPDIVVLSDRVWRRDFHADSGVVGRTLYFAREPHRVVGIAPPEFNFPVGADAWCAVVPEYDSRFGESVDSMPFLLIGRLRPGISRDAAREELGATLRATVPGSVIYASSRRHGFPLPLVPSVTPFADVVLGTDLRPAVVVLFAAVALVLIIACTNVAGLLLARGLSRGPELSVRRALGASRGQLANYLLTESALLAAAGGVLGLALAAGLIRGAIWFAPSGLPMIATAHVDPSVLAFALGVTVFAAVAFGLAPALRGANQAPQDVLRGSGRSVTASRISQIARQALVAAQVALALVVLSGAALLGRTLNALETTPLGFDAAHLLFFRLDVMAPAPRTDTAVYTRNDQVVLGLSERSSQTPGLGPMTSTLSLPFSSARPSVRYAIDGQSTLQGPVVYAEYALDDYFRVMGIPVLRGRGFTRADDLNAPRVAVVNTAFARQAWPGQDPIGRRFHAEADSVSLWWTVVGVVADDRYDQLSVPRPTIYANPRQIGQRLPDMWYAMRTRGDPAAAERLLEHTIESADHSFGISRVETGPNLLDARLARPRALAALLGSLSATALLLASIGLFGVLSAYVRERRREIAVRSALGASPARLRALVLAQTLAMSAAGVACGLPLSFGGSHALRAMVPDVRAPDAVTIIAIAAVLVAVVAAAAHGPTIRASRVDPRTALAAD